MKIFINWFKWILMEEILCSLWILVTNTEGKCVGGWITVSKIIIIILFLTSTQSWAVWGDGSEARQELRAMDVTSSHSEWRRPRLNVRFDRRPPPSLFLLLSSSFLGSGQPLPSGLHHTERFVAAGWGWMGLFECTSDDLVEECNQI